MNKKTIRVYLNSYLLYRNSKSNQPIYSNYSILCIFKFYTKEKLTYQLN